MEDTTTWNIGYMVVQHDFTSFHHPLLYAMRFIPGHTYKKAKTDDTGHTPNRFSFLDSFEKAEAYERAQYKAGAGRDQAPCSTRILKVKYRDCWEVKDADGHLCSDEIYVEREMIVCGCDCGE